jgi:hypothetical protein
VAIVPGTRQIDVLRPAGLPLPLPEPQPTRSRRAQAGAWLARHRTSIIILAVVLTAVGVVQAWGMSHSPQPLDDEGTYTAWAYAVQRFHRLGTYTYIYEHPPLGWMFIALWTWVTGAFGRASSAILAGREFMLVCQLASCSLLYVLARRLRFNRVFATTAVLLFSFAPIALRYHRFVYLDNVATPWVLAAFVLALSPRRHLGAAVGSGLCFAIAVLVKETSLMFLPGLGYLLWQQADARTRRVWLALWATVFVMSAALYAVFALLKGELLPGAGHVSMLQSAWWNAFGRQVSGSALHAGTPNHALVVDWLHNDSVLLLYGVLVFPTALFVRSLRPFAVVMAVLLVASVRSYYLPIAFIVLPISIAPLLVAGVANEAWNGVKRAWRQGAAPGRALLARSATRALAVAGVVALAAALGGVTTNWVRADGAALRDHQADHFFAAQHWVVRNLPRNSRIVLENIYWVDLVRAGWNPKDVIWHEKIDSDPAVERLLPHGYRDLDYVVSSAGLRARMDSVPMPTIQAAVAHSKVIASFGLGGDVVEVRQVEK